MSDLIVPSSTLDTTCMNVRNTTYRGEVSIKRCNFVFVCFLKTNKKVVHPVLYTINIILVALVTLLLHT